MLLHTIKLLDSHSTITTDWCIGKNEVLIIKNSTIRFSPGAGIFCLGKIEAENCTFMAEDEQKGWKGIADIGKGDSTFRGCHFSGGRGRTLGELKDHYISRYFEEIDDLEIAHFWRGYKDENCNKAYDNGTYGGALITLNSRIEECTFNACKVTREGGAILAAFRVSMIRCRFEECRAGASGGGICMKANGIISESLFLSCRARREGGGMACMRSAQVFNCHFVKCVAADGGGIAVHKDATIDDVLFKKCIATSKGGGISGSIQGTRLIFDRCVSRKGGGASLEEATGLLNSSFYRCHAYFDGGGLDLRAYKMAVVEACSFIRCSAERIAGGSFVSATTMRKCIWKGNTVNLFKRDELSVDHLYADNNAFIDGGTFEGCRVQEYSIHQFILFEAVMFQSDYCEEHIDRTSDVLMGTLLPKPLDGFHVTSFNIGQLKFCAVINDVPHVVIVPADASWGERITVELSDNENEVKFYGSLHQISENEEQIIRRFVARNYEVLKDHWNQKCDSVELLESLQGAL